MDDKTLERLASIYEEVLKERNRLCKKEVAYAKKAARTGVESDNDFYTWGYKVLGLGHLADHAECSGKFIAYDEFLGIIGNAFPELDEEIQKRLRLKSS